MYTMTVTWSNAGPGQTAYSQVLEYEIKDGILTLALGEDHDLVIPLFQVAKVDIVRHVSS